MLLRICDKYHISHSGSYVLHNESQTKRQPPSLRIPHLKIPPLQSKRLSLPLRLPPHRTPDRRQS